nr:hypothetical protein CFP56_19424 [Quercus suber]
MECSAELAGTKLQPTGDCKLEISEYPRGKRGSNLLGISPSYFLVDHGDDVWKRCAILIQVSEQVEKSGASKFSHVLNIHCNTITRSGLRPERFSIHRAYGVCHKLLSHGRVLQTSSCSPLSFSPFQSLRSHNAKGSNLEIINMDQLKPSTLSDGRWIFTQPNHQGLDHVGSNPMNILTSTNFIASTLEDDQEDDEEFLDAQEHIMDSSECSDFASDSANQMANKINDADSFRPVQGVHTINTLTFERTYSQNRLANNMVTALRNEQPSISPMQIDNEQSDFIQGDAPNEPFPTLFGPNDESSLIEFTDKGEGPTDQRVAVYARNTSQEPEDFTRGASTPPPEESSSLHKPEDSTSSNEPGPVVHHPNFPHPVKNLSPAIARHHRLHIRFQQLKPRLPLAEHRYWIAVLEHTRRPENVREEKHLVWMRGNRFTTVRTVGHYLQQVCMTADDIVLLHAGIRVKEDVMIQELDLFDDKFVYFRAVNGTSREAQGREVAQGLVVEIVELD